MNLNLIGLMTSTFVQAQRLGRSGRRVYPELKASMSESKLEHTSFIHSNADEVMTGVFDIKHPLLRYKFDDMPVPRKGWNIPLDEQENIGRVVHIGRLPYVGIIWRHSLHLA